MKKPELLARRLSRRTFMQQSTGAALAAGLTAPGVLAQTRGPIRLGHLNSFTGGIAYAAAVSYNAMELYFDSSVGPLPVARSRSSRKTISSTRRLACKRPKS